MSVMDIAVICIAVFLLSISLFFGSALLNRVAQADAIVGTVAETHITNTQNALFAFNSWFPFIFAGLVISVFIGAYFMQTHPVFMIISIGILLVFLMVSGIMVNMFDEFAGHEQFADVVDDYENVVVMWDYMPLLLLIAAIPILIILYGKRASSGPTY